MGRFDINIAQPLRGLNTAMQSYQSGVQEGERQEDRAFQVGERESYQAALDILPDMMQAGKPEEIAAFMASNPRLVEHVEKLQNFKSKETKAMRRQAFRDVASGANVNATLETLASNIEASGGDAKETRAIMALKGDEQKEAIEKAWALNFHQDWNQAQTYEKSKLPAKKEIGVVSPKDFTVESMAAYEQSGDVKVLERYRPKTVKIGNIEHSFNTETQKYEPIVDYGDSGLSDQEAAAAENQANSQARLDFGKEKSKFEAGRPKYLNSISAAEQKQTVVRNTADKIKDLMGGWSNKYGAVLSRLPATEARTLKGLIDTMKANSAFSTLTDLKASGGTLGAISEAELNLLERAWGALDQGGDIVEFERVLDQLVDQNSGSVQRARNAFDMNKGMYSGSYDDNQRSIEARNTVSWEDL